MLTAEYGGVAYMHVMCCACSVHVNMQIDKDRLRGVYE